MRGDLISWCELSDGYDWVFERPIGMVISDDLTAMITEATNAQNSSRLQIRKVFTSVSCFCREGLIGVVHTAFTGPDEPREL